MNRYLDNSINKPNFYIITNGQQTEYTYFTLLKKKKCPYNVKVIFQNLDTLNLVNFAKRYANGEDVVWCVFDVDNNYEEERLIPSLKLARKSRINIAYSNIAFEVWLISHFKPCPPSLSLKDYKPELDKILKSQKIKNTYSKNNAKILEEVFLPNYKNAVKVCEAVYNAHVRNYKNDNYTDNIYPIWEWKSTSTVFKLIEDLQFFD